MGANLGSLLFITLLTSIAYNLNNPNNPTNHNKLANPNNRKVGVLVDRIGANLGSLLFNCFIVVGGTWGLLGEDH